MSAVVVRRGTAADADAIARFANLLARLTTDVEGEMTAEAVIEDFFDPTLGLVCDVAEIDGRVAGYSMHHVAYETAFAARGRYLSDIYVDDWARRRGVAMALIRSLARETRDEGGGFIWWMAKETGAGAKGLYARIADITDPVVAHAATGDAFERLCR